MTDDRYKSPRDFSWGMPMGGVWVVTGYLADSFLTSDRYSFISVTWSYLEPISQNLLSAVL